MTLLPHYQMFIDGAWCEGASGQVRDSINPATGAVWARFACADHQDVDRAVAAAKRALVAHD
jgi:(Z)-2-((N-methylformamido)methylene)-5-hydroxybutyrolactone dehydrogenase